ncbi:hypothetical protein MASR2M69_04650 [Bacteroidota bacterium]
MEIFKISTSFQERNFEQGVLQYEKPEINVIEFVIEKGFASSTEQWDEENW